MSALTKDRADSHQLGELIAYQQKGATTIYKNSLVVANASGYVLPGSDAASVKFQGVAYEKSDNSAGSDGDVKIKIRKRGVYTFAFSGTANQAAVGQQACIVDDQTVALAATTTNDVVCGHIVEFVDAATVRVRIDEAVN